MANNVQQFANNAAAHHCKECGLAMNSAESLEVHLQYHKENLLNKWATQAGGSHEETNNNTKVKREFSSIQAADSSDGALKKSPEYGSRATPENNASFGHPPTPQSYHSASSPYQTPDNSAFSPGFQNYQIKTERMSPNYAPAYNYQDGAFFNMEPGNQAPYQQQEYVHKMPAQSSFRYHPYQQYERGNQQVSSSSPAYPPQPTPSPSPKQCDKCGYVCESATQLIEHINQAHPPTPAPHLGYPQNHFIFPEVVKTEEDAQSEILDLDSHKVVHQVYHEDDKRESTNPHSVSAMLNQWPQQQQTQQQVYSGNKFMGEPKMFASEKMFPEYVTTSTQEQSAAAAYRPFDHLPPQPTPPIISSSQQTQAAPPPTGSTKSTNWKSNEARRPKTYNCTACNKWFTSSGHLKRHYNTTLHKNAVKSSGQPDPATLPISAHHHPARESTSREDTSNTSPAEDSRSEDGLSSNGYERPGGITGLLQQPPAGPYDRQIHHLHPNTMPASPPNGEAGPSATNNIDSRGLLSINNTPGTSNGFSNNTQPAMIQQTMDNQFQMYPNESAPHVTQLMATNSLSTTGDYQEYSIVPESTQPLPSFAQFNNRYGLLVGYSAANVGGPGPATAPYSYYDDSIYRNDEDYKLTVLTAGEDLPPYSPNNNTINDLKTKFETQPASPEKARIKRDYEDTSSPKITSSTIPVNKNIHKCYDCDKVFNKSCYLTQHNKTFHSGDKPFKCPRCGKRFSCDEQYQEHLSKHAGEKPHKCDLCPKQFNHKTDLRRHMCLHTGQKPYACDTCGKGFIRKDHMLKHCETHMKKSQHKIMQAAR